MADSVDHGSFQVLAHVPHAQVTVTLTVSRSASRRAIAAMSRNRHSSCLSHVGGLIGSLGALDREANHPPLSLVSTHAALRAGRRYRDRVCTDTRMAHAKTDARRLGVVGCGVPQWPGLSRPWLRSAGIVGARLAALPLPRTGDDASGPGYTSLCSVGLRGSGDQPYGRQATAIGVPL
jgi:hypothetical protein